MFILRFIGRILSIGFILFIALIVTGKNSNAESTWVVSEPAVESLVVHKVETLAVSIRRLSFWRSAVKKSMDARFHHPVDDR